MPFRPKTLREVAQRASDLEAWGGNIAEFLDEVGAWRKAGTRDRVAVAVQEEPPLLHTCFAAGDAADAFGAALAEYLAQLDAFPVPSWTQQRYRFLSRPWFPLPHIADHPRLRALLEAQTPEAFRRHNIYIDENSLVRA